MTAGIPGAGLGGLFYLLSAMWMPVQEGWAMSRGRSTPARRALIGRQLLLATGIVCSMAGLAWVLERAIEASALLRAILGFGPAADLPRILNYSALGIGLGTLLAVYLVVQLTRLACRPARQPADPPLTYRSS